MNERAVRLLLNGAGAEIDEPGNPLSGGSAREDGAPNTFPQASTSGSSNGRSPKRNLDELAERADRILARREEEARALVAFADGLEEAGETAYARRSRSVARDLLETARELREERSLRVAIQNERDRVRRLVSRNGYDGREER